jgi:hypothetical protein
VTWQPVIDENYLPHGTISGYKWYRCRCDACRRANADYQRDYMQRKPQQQLLHAARQRRSGQRRADR